MHIKKQLQRQTSVYKKLIKRAASTEEATSWVLISDVLGPMQYPCSRFSFSLHHCTTVGVHNLSYLQLYHTIDESKILQSEVRAAINNIKKTELRALITWSLRWSKHWVIWEQKS